MDGSGDAEATATAPDAAGTAAAAARPERKDKNALADKAVQLFDLFDGERRVVNAGGYWPKTNTQQ